MDVTKLATQLLLSKLGGSQNSGMVESVIGSLLGGSKQQGIDLGGLVENLQNSGLSNLAESWLGDGPNEQVSESQLESLLGGDKIQQAASQLGADPSDLLAGLKDMIPQVVDQNSKGGSLLDAVGGVSGLAGLVGKFLRK